MERIYISPRQVVKVTAIAYLTVVTMKMIGRKLKPVVDEANAWTDATR